MNQEFDRTLNSDFLAANYFSNSKKFNPQDRNQYLLHSQVVYNLKLHTDFPLVLHIEPTNKCNQKCRMCCHPTQKRKETNTTDLIVHKAIAEAKIFRPWSTNFFFFGEPFLNKNIFDYFELAAKSNLRNISTTTNLTALTLANVKRLPSSGLNSIHISFEGLNREHYKMVRGKDTFQRAKRNILALVNEREKQNSKLWISITFVRTDETDDQIEQFTSEWRGLVNDLHISPQFEYRNGSADGSRRQSISKIQIYRNDGNIMFTDNDRRVPCRQLWTRIVVTSNGEMVPCSQNIDAELTLGNILEKSIHEAWTGEQMQNLRMEHLSNDFRSMPGKVCRNCTDWDWSGKMDSRPEKGALTT